MDKFQEFLSFLNWALLFIVILLVLGIGGLIVLFL